MFLSSLRISVISFLAFTVLCGIVYPAAVTGILQATFHDKANGSLIYDKSGKAIGSELIGQQFDDPKYFWGRLSATSPIPYNASSSSGSNLGVNNTTLHDNAKARIAALKTNATANTPEQVPVDLVTASGSGLDPDISLAAAFYQVLRIAAARHIPEDQVKDLIQKNIKDRQWGVFGEPRVNVLSLNLALEGK